MGLEDTAKKVTDWLNRMGSENRDVGAVMALVDWPLKQLIKKDDGTGIEQGYFFPDPKSGAPAINPQFGVVQTGMLYNDTQSLSDHVDQTIMAFDTFVRKYIYSRYLSILARVVWYPFPTTYPRLV